MTRPWFPLGAVTHHGPPPPGSLVAAYHAVWRVRSVAPVPVTDWTTDDDHAIGRLGEPAEPWVVVLRPARLTDDDPAPHRRDRHLRVRRGQSWHVYPDGHYPICGACAEPTPCREREAAQEARRQAERMARFDTPGVCPSCGEPVTARQKSRTFAENVVVPLGPPVTFHTRARCHADLLDYEDVWVAADPGHRVSSRPPVCPGTEIIHPGTGVYDCSLGARCPGVTHPRVVHRSMTACQHAGCGEHPGGFGGAADAHARHTAFTGGTSGGEVA